MTQPPRLAMGKAEHDAVLECLAYYRQHEIDPGYQGAIERSYTEAFCRYMGGGYADAVCSGTNATFIALKALNLPPGRHVLVSTITDPGTLAAIILAGYHPLLCDTAPGSYNIGLDQIAVRRSLNLAAILVVHATGQPVADIRDIVEWAHRIGVGVIEDCSQAHGAAINGRKVGTFGDIAVFSTMYRKAHMTGGTGGVVYTRDEALYHTALAHADRGKPRWRDDFSDTDPRYYLFPALNHHTDEISCAIGLASLGRLDETIAARRAFVRTLAERLKAASQWLMPSARSEEDSPFFFPIFVNEGRDKRQITSMLTAAWININPHYRYNAWEWRWLERSLADSFIPENACKVIDRSFCLRLNENYGEREVDQIMTAVERIEATSSPWEGPHW